MNPKRGLCIPGLISNSILASLPLSAYTRLYFLFANMFISAEYFMIPKRWNHRLFVVLPLPKSLPDT